MPILKRTSKNYVYHWHFWRESEKCIKNKTGKRVNFSISPNTKTNPNPEPWAALNDTSVHSLLSVSLITMQSLWFAIVWKNLVFEKATWKAEKYHISLSWLELDNIYWIKKPLHLQTMIYFLLLWLKSIKPLITQCVQTNHLNIDIRLESLIISSNNALENTKRELFNKCTTYWLMWYYLYVLYMYYILFSHSWTEGWLSTTSFTLLVRLPGRYLVE